MLWRCPKLHRYWESIFDILNSLCFTHIPPDPKITVLGVIPEDTLPNEVHAMWLKTMYMARKLILQKCILNCSPMIDQWIKATNLNLG